MLNQSIICRQNSADWRSFLRPEFTNISRGTRLHFARWNVRRQVIPLLSLSLSTPVMAACSYLALPNVSSPSSSSSSSSNKLSSSIFGSVSLKKTPLAYHFLQNQPLYLTSRSLTVKSMAPPKPAGKAKKVVGIVKLALDAGKATPAPPVGPALGSKGVNIMAFCKEYNSKTADKAGYVIPVEITVYDDKSFTFVLKTPPASVLLLKAAGVEKGSKEPKSEKVGKITIDQLRAIATEKLPDLNCSSIESAMRIIAGTAANMGVDIDPPVLEPKKKAVL